ncbi:MAG: hypothetical protein HN686_06665 [Bacteroidetes bacterium]|nr:hypothetical protein [Bacteroidota bacterium]
MKNLLSLLGLLLIVNFCFSQNEYAVTAKKPAIEQAGLSPENEFIQKNFPYIPLAEWPPGMRFMLDQAGMSSPLQLFDSRRSKVGSQVDKKEYENTIFTLLRIVEKEIKVATGRKTFPLFIFGHEDLEFVYIYPGSLQDLKAGIYPNFILNLIFLGDIDKAREILIGKKLFLKSRIVNEEGSTRVGTLKNVPKYIPVTITNVGLGKSVSPVKIVFENAEGNEFFVEILLSGINSRDSYGISDFDRYFFLQDPRSRYPHISDDIWEKIQIGKIQIGMTEEMVKLSWGPPEKINRSSGGDQWVYKNQYLYFENGKMTSFN